MGFVNRVKIMKNIIAFSLALGSFVTVSSSVFAAGSEVEWFEPEHYSDIRPANENRKSYRKRVFKSLEKHIAKQSSKLPSDQTLIMKFTDVDLAGDVRYMVGPNNMDVRVIKDIYIPRLKFEYKLLDGDKQVIQQGAENIKDMSFTMNTNLRRNHESYYYEKNLLDDWFKSTFKESFKK